MHVNRVGALAAIIISLMIRGGADGPVPFLLVKRLIRGMTCFARRSQSKASYLSAYKREPREREKGLPNFEGSYKRTASPNSDGRGGGGGGVVDAAAAVETLQGECCQLLIFDDAPTGDSIKSQKFGFRTY